MSTNLFAGDYAHLHFIGFSRDARYMAFEEFGIMDYEGHAYSSIYFIDVENNIFAAAPVKTVGKSMRWNEDDEEFMEPVRHLNRIKAATGFRKFRIVEGNTGILVAAHVVNELPPVGDEKGSESGIPMRVAFTKRGNTLYREGYWEIDLKETPTGEEKYGQKLETFQLTLKNESGEATILQKAGKLPKTRESATGYAFQQAFRYRNRLAVFVGVFSRGWEGDDMRFVAVTGRLE
jgi:predicted secreted protein